MHVARDTNGQSAVRIERGEHLTIRGTGRMSEARMPYIYPCVYIHTYIYNDHPGDGPQVVEVNNRLTRGFLGHNFAHQLLFGQHIIDYYGAVFSLSMGGMPMVRACDASVCV